MEMSENLKNIRTDILIRKISFSLQTQLNECVRCFA